MRHLVVDFEDLNTRALHRLDENQSRMALEEV